MKNWKKDFYAKYSSYFKREFDKSSYNGFEPYGIHIMNIAFPKEKNINIVDLACGIGGYLNIFKSKGYENILGVDTSEEEVEYAHKNELLEVKQGDIFKFFEKSVSKTYDIVIALDIIEHLETDELLIFLKESHRILKNEGKLIIHAPNAEGIFGSRVRYSDITHESAFTQNSISQICTFAGFSNINCFEDKPLIYSITSFFRRLIWEVLTIQFRFLHAAETGNFKVILSQNFLTVAKK